MAYSYYNKTEGTGVIATNLRAIESASGIKYNTLTYWFRNGTTVKKSEDFVILKSELIKGKQKVTKKLVEIEPSKDPEPEPEVSGDLFDQIKL